MSFMNHVINIDKPAYGGKGLSFNNGKIMFVPFVITGETVEISVIREKKDYAEAFPLQIVKRSPDRIVPDCSNFARCGGCDYLHMTYDREIAEKQSIIIDAMIRQIKFDKESLPAITTITGPRFRYRSHARVKSDGKLAGFFAKDSHDIVPFPTEGCLLLDEGLSSAVMKPFLDSEIKCAIDAHGSIITSGPDEKAEIIEEVSGIRFVHNVWSFFQANRFLRGRMIDTVIDYAHPSHSDDILELGCGCGFFTLPLARRCGTIKGIDINTDSIRYAVRNAAGNIIMNASFEPRDDASIDSPSDRADIIIADPPRAGLSKKTRDAIVGISPERFVYVSCDISTWARDARGLIMRGYRLSRLTFIDMFPGTYHIELISLFEKQDNSISRIKKTGFV
jgi:23S rRNA (uracil1939-C5)-methyltransferase